MLNRLATTAILALVLATPAFAQAPAASDTGPASDSNTGLSEVIVTARRREESIRDVPGTISAVSSEQLDSKGPIAGSGDLLNTVPGVRFNDVASENLAEVSVRGSGTQRATGADSGVGLFVNGAYAGSSTLGGRNFKTLDYFDLERVEVLEGPQGALYGRNSEFGVVNIILNKPKFQNSAYVRDEFTFGLDQNRIAAVVNYMLTDNVAVRIGGERYGQTRGFYYDPNHDKYYDSTSGGVGRAQIRYRSGPLDVTLLFDGQQLHLPSFVNSLRVPGGGVNPQIPLGYQQSRFDLPHTGIDGLQQKVVRTMLLAGYEFSDALRLDWITMATQWHSNQQYASAIDEATAISMRQQNEIGIWPYGQVRTNVKDRTFYQDLHFTGTAAGGNLMWTAGGEGLFQSDDYQLLVTSSPCAFTLAGSFCSGTPIQPVCVKPRANSPNCPTPFPLIYGTDSNTDQHIKSYAGYASLQYSFGNLSLVGEGRFTHDNKEATQGITALYTTTYTKIPTTYSFDADQPAYTFTASYKIPAASTLVYAKVGTGYRAGGVNNGTFNALAPNPFVATYGNEKTIGYEAGAKVDLTRNIFLRVSGYLSQTDDAITSLNDGCTPTNICGTGQQFFNVNGGTIHAHGIEASLDGRFHTGPGLLSIALNASSQRAHFAKVPTGGATGLPIQGSTVAQIPDTTMSAVIDYRQPITERLNGFINVSYSGQRGGGQDTVTVATPFIPLSDFDIFGARTGFDYNDLAVSLFVRNLTDQEVQVLKFTQANNPLSVRWNKPRTYGVSASYRW